jgi:hypothetical protein
MSDLGEAIREESANDLLRAVHHVPVVDYLSLFVTLVPHRTHDEEGGLANRFEDTEEGSDCDESGKAEAESVAAEGDGPQHDVGTEEFCYRYALDRPVYRIFHEQDRNVDTGSKPSKLCIVSQDFDTNIKDIQLT